MKIEERNKKKRGASVIVLSMFFMILLSVLATTLYKVVPLEMHQSYRAHKDLRGHYVARAGVQHTMKWLSSRLEAFEDSGDPEDLPDYNSGTADSPVYPNIPPFEAAAAATTPFNVGDWRYEVEVMPIKDTTEIHDFVPRLISIRSTAFHNDVPVRRIDTLVRQQTFASFAFYTDQMDPSSKFIIDGETRIQGPVHTNDWWRFEASPGLWGDDSADPYFLDQVTHTRTDPTSPPTGDGNTWLGGAGNAPYDTSGVIAGRYEKVFEEGRNALRVKSSVDLPSSTEGILAEVWTEGLTNLPTERGLHLSVDSSDTVDGGLYFNGDVDRARMELTTSGNQKMRFVDDGVKVGTKEVTATKWVPDKSAGTKTVTKTKCVKWGPPDGAGDGSGVNGGSLNNVCKKWEKYTTTDWVKYDKVEYTKTVDVKEDFMWEVIEAVESAETFTYLDTDGNPQSVTVNPGQTLVASSQGNDFSKSDQMKYGEVEVYDGFINGSMYFDGNIGNENNGEEGLWGIVKGSPEYDASTGAVVTDSDGKTQYINKTIITPLNKSVSLGGDLLQFNQEKFEARGGAGGNHAGVSNWKNVALDPSTGELSPDNSHVTGIVSRDVWLKGPKNSNWRNGNDGYNDVYAVILAGKTEKDSSGEVITDADGRPITSGGFGTWRQDRDQLKDGLGKYRIFGGVIQGTTGANYKDKSSDAHYWTTGGVGYEVDLQYDVEATRQRIFPNYAEFRILRWLERPSN
jgi:hypothetical protein